LETHGLPHAPPYAIARHSFADRARYCKADARTARFRVPQAKSREEGTGKAATFIINFTEISRPQDTGTFRKTWDGRLPFVADGKFLSSSGATASKHGAAILGFHAAAETVRLDTLAIIRLKSAFRHFSSSI
jgi:hypothetical protein